MSRARPPGFVVASGLTLAGLLIWSVHFVAIYGFVGLACARGWARPADAPLDPASLFVLAATLLAGLAILWALAGRRRLRLRRDGDFLSRLALAIGALSLLAILWEGMAVFFVPACQ